MAKKNASPTGEQAQIIAKRGLDRMLWVVIKDLPKSMIVKHRLTGEFRVIEK